MNFAAYRGETMVQRYECMEQGKVFGFVEYYEFDDICIVTHTEITLATDGLGYGSRTANQALEYFRQRDKRVVPICGFLVHYLRKNLQHLDLITMESRRIFNIENTP